MEPPTCKEEDGHVFLGHKPLVYRNAWGNAFRCVPGLGSCFHACRQAQLYDGEGSQFPRALKFPFTTDLVSVGSIEFMLLVNYY